MSDGISFFESRRSWNPNGIPAQSPGLRGTSYPGSASKKHSQPQRRSLQKSLNGENDEVI
jgi:hypothetical protein